MLLVPTKLLPSKIQGFGLFAAQSIKKGTKIWEFTPGLDLEITVAEFHRMPKLQQHFIRWHGYLNAKRDLYILLADNARFFNHDDKANVISVLEEDGEGYDVAARNIRVGEEMTNNYYSFDGEALLKLGRDLLV